MIISMVIHVGLSVLAVRKLNGKVRIYTDYSTGFSDALEANYYPLPTPEEIVAQLTGSIIDLSVAYLQIEVDEESKQLLTINTHRGLFRFNRAKGKISTGSFPIPGGWNDHRHAWRPIFHR